MKTLENLNRQFNMELQASHMYLQFSIWCEFCNFKGFAEFMLKQSEEERGHALRIKDFAINWITSNKTNVNLLDVNNLNQPSQLISIVALMGQVLEAEQAVTESIRSIIVDALAEQDYATIDFFNPFMTMQIESLAEVNYIIDKIKLCGDNIAAIMEFDEEVGEM